jgi:hypothetical protein
MAMFVLDQAALSDLSIEAFLRSSFVLAAFLSCIGLGLALLIGVLVDFLGS